MDPPNNPSHRYRAKPGVPTDLSRYHVVTLYDCEDSLYDEQSENKMLIVLLITLKHGSKSARKTTKTFAGSQYSRHNPASRLRLGPMSATFDRLLTFADLTSKGKVCSMLTQTPSESDHLFRYTKDDIAIGTCFAILEPDRIQRMLGQDDNSIVDTQSPLVPLTSHQLAPVHMTLKPNPGKTNWFHIPGCTDVIFNKAEIVDACCSGILCDRQKKLKLSAACGCFFKHRFSSIVLRANITIPFSDDDGDDDATAIVKKYTVLHFMSWRTTQLFLKNIGMTTRQDTLASNTQAIRQTVKDIVEHVNSHGGWDITGWVRCGTQADALGAGSHEDTDISALGHLPHISRLWPSTLQLEDISGMRYCCT